MNSSSHCRRNKDVQEEEEECEAKEAATQMEEIVSSATKTAEVIDTGAFDAQEDKDKNQILLPPDTILYLVDNERKADEEIWDTGDEMTGVDRHRHCNISRIGEKYGGEPSSPTSMVAVKRLGEDHDTVGSKAKGDNASSLQYSSLAPTLEAASIDEQPPIMRRQNRHRRNVQPGAQWVGGLNDNDSNNQYHCNEINDIALSVGIGGTIDPTTAAEIGNNGNRINNGDNHDLVVSAVSPDELEAEYRQRVLDSNTEIQDATVLSKEEIDSRRRRNNILILLFAIMATVSVILVLVRAILGTTKMEQELVTTTVPTTSPIPTMVPTASPTKLGTPKEQLFNLLISRSKALYEEENEEHPFLRDDYESTSQYKCYQWLLRHFSLVLPKSNVNIMAEDFEEKLIIESGSDSDLRLLQYYGLCTFYASTKGQNWNIDDATQTWSNIFDSVNVNPTVYIDVPMPEPIVFNDICGWFGIACSANSGNDLQQVTELSFTLNGLAGSIPPEISFISPLNKMQTVIFQFNNIAGTIPSSLFKQWSSSLQRFHLANTRIRGSIPTTIGLATNLESLLLGGNQLSGPIPNDMLGTLTKLTDLDISNNRALGMDDEGSTIPTSISNLKRLQRFQTEGVAWVGTIPSEIGLLKNQLEFIGIEHAAFVVDSTIPTEIYGLSKLRYFSIKHSQLGGTLSSLIGQLTSLRTLDLSQNQITGTIPSEIGQLADTLQVAILLEGNSLEGGVGDLPHDIAKIIE